MTQAKVTYRGDLQALCTHESGAQIETDAPRDIGGKGAFFSPTDLLAISLPSCILITMDLVARKLGYDLKGAQGSVRKEMTDTPKRRIGKLTVQLELPRAIPEALRPKLENAAHSCPVHHSLHPDIALAIAFRWSL